MFLDKYMYIPCDDRYGGKNQIKGTLSVNGYARARRVYLTDRSNYRLIAVTFSDESGHYQFDRLSQDIEFDLRAQDWKREYVDDTLSAVKAKPYG